jgi:hypothetical protein
MKVWIDQILAENRREHFASVDQTRANFGASGQPNAPVGRKKPYLCRVPWALKISWSCLANRARQRVTKVSNQPSGHGNRVTRFLHRA